MSALDDDQDVWGRDERLIAGEPVEGEPELATFLAVLRSEATQAPPAPSAALAALLRHGAAVPAAAAQHRPVPAAGARHLRGVAARMAAVGLAGKLALGAGVAVAAVGTAAATHVLPPPVQHAVDGMVTTIVDALTGQQPAAPSAPPGPARQPAPPSTPDLERAPLSPSDPPAPPPAPEPAAPAPDDRLGGHAPRPAEAPATSAPEPTRPARPAEAPAQPTAVPEQVETGSGAPPQEGAVRDDGTGTPPSEGSDQVVDGAAGGDAAAPSGEGFFSHSP